jgi:hypothetical protein
MAIIVTYDVPNKHLDLKKLLLSKGYTDKIAHFQDGVYKDIYLPNTTLYHASKSATEGREDLKTCTTALQVKLERCVSTQWGPNWAAIFGDPFSQ